MNPKIGLKVDCVCVCAVESGVLDDTNFFTVIENLRKPLHQNQILYELCLHDRSFSRIESHQSI